MRSQVTHKSERYLCDAVATAAKDLCRAILALVVLTLPFSVAAQNMIQIDRARQIARADLDYDTPASRCEEGMPIGNGRMGTLVWTTPSALKMQINRVDVHAVMTVLSIFRAYKRR